MKTNIIIPVSLKALGIGLIMSVGALSSNSQVVDNNIKVNTFGALVGQYQLSFERSISEKTTLQLGAGVISRKGTLTFGESDPATFKTSGIIVIPEIRHYFSEAPKGFYAAAFARLRSTKFVYSFVDETTSDDWGYKQPRLVLGGGAVLGVQPIIGDHVVLDLFVGPQFKSVSSKTTYNDPSLDRSSVEDEALKGGLGVRFGMNLGVAF